MNQRVKVRKWRNSDPPENTPEVRLPGRCRPNMLATSPSHHNPSHKFKAGTPLRLCERSEIKIIPCKFLSTCVEFIGSAGNPLRGNNVGCPIDPSRPCPQFGGPTVASGLCARGGNFLAHRRQAGGRTRSSQNSNCHWGRRYSKPTTTTRT